MVDLLDNSGKDNVIAVRVAGKISKEDYDTLNPLIEEKINQHGKVNMLFEMSDVDEVELGSMWEELKFDAQHAKDINKIAVVGSRTSEKLLTNIKKPMTSAETKFFDQNDRDAAMNWL